MSIPTNILVTGANGQLGMEFRAIAETFPQYQFHFASKEELSIDNEAMLTLFFKRHAIDACINCAAYTAVDKAEAEKEQAIAINTEAPAMLAGICKKMNASYFHFSTDYVFNGKATQPYQETDATEPVNFYGQTKLAGEQAVFNNYPGAIIIRTSWVYSSYGKNFVKTMLKLMQERESLGVVADQSGSPTYAADLAAAVMQIIGEDKSYAGIYHYCNAGVITWYDFATAIKELSHSTCMVKPITTADYPTPARRPHYSALDTQKIRRDFDLQVPAWRDSLQQCIQLLVAQ